MAASSDEILVFADESKAPSEPDSLPWQILIVDDDPDVHATTKLALRGLTVEGRELRFVDAYSAEEGLRLLQQDPDFSVALVDVVMERDDSGLSLVQTIRDKLHNHSIRLILRTGQPGYAPESETIRCYDINDYKTKSELTRVRLFTSIAIAIRSYSQLRQLEANRNGLEQILEATSELSQRHDLKRFTAGVVTQICALLNVPRECLICAALEPEQAAPFIVASGGRYSDYEGLSLDALPVQHVRQRLTSVLQEQHHRLDDSICVYLPGPEQQALAAFVDLPYALTTSDQRLLEVFCSNVAVAFENLQLYGAMKQLAYQDTLVGLPNRNGFVAAIERHIASDAQPGQALALVDLDNFSYMNSVLDDAFGDAILHAVAQRLRSSLSPDTVVARVGGDVFGILGSAEEITPERISDLFAKPLELHQNEPLRISATSGLKLLDQESQSAASIIKDAGVALKQAKHFYRGETVLFTNELADAARERMQLLSRLRTAFTRDRLQLHFQPFIRLSDGAAVGAEALLRWKNEEGNYIPPDQFIPLAEQSGMMVALGDWVISTALRWRNGMIGYVRDDFRIAINVSLVQMREEHFADKLIQCIRSHDLEGYQVEIELTESIAVDDMAGIQDKLETVRNHGVSTALDDFGTGYSSLNVLSRLPIDRLKIDRSFVSGHAADEPRFTMAHTMLELASNFQMRTIAEGIETDDQRDALFDLGCQEGQGFLLSKPLDQRQFSQWLLRSG
ncbi:EAL domain-containing protein [Halomonadaceae bacterium KBTZ08]